MSKKNANYSYVLTANDLATGDIVFWSTRGHWSSNGAEALVVAGDLEGEHLRAQGDACEAANVVVGAYLVPLEARAHNGGNLGAGCLFPVQLREQRRMFGPSITYGASGVDGSNEQRLAA